MNIEEQNLVRQIILENPKGYASIIRFKHKAFKEWITDTAEGVTFSEKLYNWMYPGCKNTCVYCGQKTKFDQFSNGYQKFCNCSCRAKHFECNKFTLSPEIIFKRNESLRSRSKQVLQDVKKKRNDTLLQKFGPDATRILYERSRLKYNEKHYTIDALKKLSDKEWLESEHIINKKTIGIIAHSLNVGNSAVQLAFKKHGIKNRIKNSNSSILELKILDWLEDLNVNVLHRNKICKKEIDLLIPNSSMGIEICGSYWHHDSNRYSPKDKNCHQSKYLLCKEHEIELLTIFDFELKHKEEIVKSRILSKLGNNQKIGARKTIIRELTKKESSIFFNETHIQGNCGNKICFGLIFGDEIVAAMSFGKPRYSKKHQFEMIRFSTKLNTTIMGGASKLFNHFVKIYDPINVISYSNNRWGSGKLYMTLGFDFLGITPPSHFYVNRKTLSVTHRSAFMKHKIIRDLNGDANKTAHENMKDLGYYRIWDCGTSKFEWNNVKFLEGE
jgi:hypothetical protein